MIRVFADNFQIDLADNPAIEVQLNSPVVGITQQGSVVYPFSCPFTANNDDIFSFFRLPESSIDRTKTFVGRIYDDSLLIMEGILSIKKTDTSYSIEIAGPPAGVSETFWNKAINQVDIGSHEFNVKGVTTNLYALKITPEIEPYFGLAGSTLKIYQGTRIFVNYLFPPFISNFYNQLNDSGTNRTFGEIMQAVAYQFNEDNNLRTEGYELVISSKGINFFAPDTLTEIINLKVSVSYTVAEAIGSGTTVTKVFDFSRVVYLAPDTTGLQNNTTINNPFVCPTIYNQGFYNEKNKIWSKFVNWYDGKVSKYAENTFRNPTAYTLVPMLSLHYVIKQFLTLMNYQGIGQFFSDETFKKIIVENTQSIDKQCESCDLTFNIFNTKIDFKNHLPGFTIQEFFDELKQHFGLTIEYDYINRKCKIDFIQPIIDSVENEDFTNKVGKIVSLETSSVKKIQFAYDNSFIPDADKSHEIYQPTPADDVVEASPDDYTTLKTKIGSLPVQIFDPAVETLFIRPRVNGQLVTGTGTTTVTSGVIRMYPKCNQLGNSVLYAQDKQDFGMRLLIFLGKQTDPQGIEIIRADYQNDSLNLSLSSADQKSRYNRLLKSYQYYLENAVEAETEVFLNDAELAAFDWRKKKYIRGIHYLVHQLLPTLPIKQAFKMKMKRTV